MRDYIRDGWNWVHLIGSFALSLVFFELIGKWAYLVVFILGLTWEMLDEMNKRFNWHRWFFDADGFDIRDVITDVLGITLALLWRTL